MKKRIVGIITALVMVIGLCMNPASTRLMASAENNRHELSAGVQSIVKRAYQMTDIQWTPLADIPAWNNELTYKAGVTYTGLPYGQPVYASYVPWSTNLNGFISAVNDANSKMYTSRSTYDKVAPYYSCDCSAFVSWAWGLNSRQTTSTIKNFATKISDTSYDSAEVGDCLCLSGSHVVLITDITYDANDVINGIEISESTVNLATNYCCQKTWYGTGYSHSLAELQSKYLNNGYILYRCNTRDSVKYTHSCASPLEGDVCTLCGFGSYKATPVCAEVIINAETPLYIAPDGSSENLGTLYSGCTLEICAYASDEKGRVWYKSVDNEWFTSDTADVTRYLKTVSISDKSFPSGNMPQGKAFPVKGMITAKNEITSIYAAIFYEGNEYGKAVQEMPLTLDNTYFYSLAGSVIDNSMVFNDLLRGSYTFVLKITEQAYCPGGPAAESITTTETSTFSIGNDTPTNYGYLGIDVSHHQGAIDWNAVAEKIDFAIVRCGYGDDLTEQDDMQWEANASACERLGIPYGVYIYSYALTDDQALSEAQHVLRLLKGHNPTLPIYLDLEDKSIGSLSNEDLLRHTKIFCSAISAAGYEVGVYSSYYWWTTKLTSADYDSWSRWIAIWGTSSPGYNKNFDMWQFTDSGSVSGIGGAVDMDYWYGELPTAGCCHEYETTTIAEASCTECGTVRHTCTKCGYSYTEDIQPLGHDYVLYSVVATCEHGGYTSHVCSRCNDIYDDNFTDTTDHLFENGRCIYCGIEEIQPGDLNGDGEVTSADSVMLSRYLADLVELTQEQLLAADVNGDGDVTSADSVILARFLAGLISEFVTKNIE